MAKKDEVTLGDILQFLKDHMMMREDFRKMTDNLLSSETNKEKEK